MQKLGLSVVVTILMLGSGASSRAADRYDITVKQDFSRTARATLDDKGGTLEADAADGTHFKLVVPEGALTSRVRVLMTPVDSKADNFPFKSGIAAGVQLEPEGLILFKPATLTIELPKDADAKNNLGFCHDEDGVDFHLCPNKLSGRTVEMRLVHFSGYATGNVSAEEEKSFTGSYPPTSSQAQGEQDASAAISAWRQSGDEGQLQAVGARKMADWADRIYKELRDLERQTTDLTPSDVFQLCNELEDYDRLCQDLGFSSNAANLYPELISLLHRLALQTLRECWNDNASRPVAEIAADALAITRQAELMGGGNYFSDDLMSELSGCLRFDLDFRSAVTFTTPKGNIMAQLNGTITATYDPQQNGLLVGNDDLHFNPVQTTLPVPGGCTINWSKGAKRAEVAAIRFTLGQASYRKRHMYPVRPGRPVPPRVPGDDDGDTSKAKPGVQYLIFSPNKPEEKLEYDCEIRGQKFNIAMGSIWYRGFKTLHLGEMERAGEYEAFNFKSWDASGGGVRGVLAQKTYQQNTSAGGGSFEEITELTLRHNPSKHKPSDPAPSPHPQPQPRPEPAPPTADSLAATYDNDLRRWLQDSANDQDARGKFEAFGEWYGQASAFPAQLGSRMAEGKALMMDALGKILDASKNACKSHNATPMAAMLGWLQWGNQQALVRDDPKFQAAALHQAIVDCAKYNMEFSGHIHTIKGEPMDMLLKGAGPLNAELDEGQALVVLKGQLTADYKILAWPHGDCTVETHPWTDPFFDVARVELALDTTYRKEKVEVRFADVYFGKQMEHIIEHCPRGSGAHDFQVWKQYWFALHADERAVDGRGERFHFEKWDAGAQEWEMLATKKYQRVRFEAIAEETELRLIPQ